MNLMICDDQKSELENMGQIVSEYALTHSELSLTVKCFLNPFDMLDEMGKSGVPEFVCPVFWVLRLHGRFSAKEKGILTLSF